MSDKKDDFDDLFVDENEVFDKKLTIDILQPYVQFTKNEDIITKPAYDKLKSKGKILIILLSKKVLQFRRGEQERVSPKEVETLSGIPHGSVSHMLPELEKDRYVKSEHSKYWIPNYALNRLKEFIEGSKT